MLEIQTKRLPPDIAVVQMTGRITIGRDSKEVEWTMARLVDEGGRKVIFDLAGVTHIDSTGVGIIMMSAGQVKSVGGELRVSGASGHVEQVLKMTKVDQIVGLHPTIDVAAAGF